MSAVFSTLRVLVVEPTSSIRTWIDLALEDAAAILDGLEDGDQLRSRLVSGKGAVDVVVANARIPGASTMQVLAQLRAAGIRIPFVVVRGFHGRGLHVFIGEPDGSRLVSRIVTADEFRDMVVELARESQRVRAA